MGGACGDHVKMINIFVVEKFKLFGKEVFSGKQFRIKIK